MRNMTINGISNYEYNEDSAKFDNLALKRKRVNGLKASLGGLVLGVTLAVASNHMGSKPADGFIYDSEYYAQDMETGNASLAMQLEKYSDKDISPAMESAIEKLSFYENAKENYEDIASIENANADDLREARVSVVTSTMIFSDVARNVILDQVRNELNLSANATIDIDVTHSNADGSTYRIIVKDGDDAYEIDSSNYIKLLNSIDSLSIYRGTGDSDAWAKSGVMQDYIEDADKAYYSILNTLLSENIKINYETINRRSL